MFLQIVGRIGKSGLGVVSAYLISTRLDVHASVRFYVDTGASHTSIADRDAQRIGIDYRRLKKAPYQVSGVGGVVDAYLLPNCMLVFRFSQSAHIEYLDNIVVMKHSPQTEEERRRVWEVPSLLESMSSNTMRYDLGTKPSS